MKKILSIIFLLTLGKVEAQTVLKFSDFTAETAPAGTDYLVGYRTPGVAGGNRRYSLSTLQTYFASGSQPLDADLTAIAALSGTNTIYYRSAANTWSPVTFVGATFSGGVLTITGGSGSGDVSSNTSSSIDGEAAVFLSTGGKTIKRATGTGVAHLTSGVLSASSVNLASEVTGVLPIANYATGTPTGSKFVRDDGTLQAIPGGGDALVANPLSQFAATTSAQLAGVITNETGSGPLVFSTSPTLVTPALGTPSAVVLTNATGLPLTTGVTGTLPVANGGTGTTTPGIVAGSNVTVTGTWPNQTVNSTGGSGTPISYHATSNTTGDSTITAAQAVHIEVVTFGGTNGTRRLSLLTSGAAAGYRVTLQAIFGSSGNITMELYNASTGGTLLGTFTTDGAEANGMVEFYFDGTAWKLLSSQIPAF